MKKTHAKKTPLSNRPIPYTSRTPLRHRDYRLPEDIRIRIFTNRIEVDSPGVFPGGVTLENVREIGSKPRNRAIVDHLREFPKPPNLDAGEGVRMMFATMESDGLYPPVYEEENQPECELVRVKLLNEARLSEWDLVRDHLTEHRAICNADIRQMLNLGSNSVRASKLLRGWVDRGLLEVANPHEGKRNRRYQLRVTAKAGVLLDWLSHVGGTFTPPDSGDVSWQVLFGDDRSQE